MVNIIGSSNDDVLIGTAGNDTIFGLEGDDLINPGPAGNDTVDGGDGFDTLDLSDLDFSFVFASGSGGTISTSTGFISFDNFEAIIGTDVEAVSGISNFIDLQSASHGYTIDVGGGLDIVYLSPYADTVTLGADQGDLVRGTSMADYDGDVFTDWDNSDSMGFLGFTFDASNVIRTSTATETTLEIDGDRDGVTDATVTLLGDYRDGSFEYLNNDAGTFVYWNSNTGETLSGGEGINIFRGSLGDDTYNGLGGNDFLSGDAGNDTLNGGDGDDSLNPGTGSSDVVDGGDGFDTLVLSDYHRPGGSISGAFVFAFGNNGTAQSWDASDTVVDSTDFSNIEAIIGTDFEATSSGYGDAILLISASHGYTIDAGAGLDLVYLTPFADTVTLGADQGDQVRGFSMADYDGDVFTDWDNSDSMGFMGFTFDGSNVIRTSTDTETTLEIDGDRDGVTDATVTLLGDYRDGSFEFLNDSGNTYIYWNSNTGEALDGGEGRNFFRGSLGDDTYNGLGGNDQLQGDAGNDTLNGGDGDDLLSGEGGIDTLTGGAGVDTFHANSPDEFDGDTITDLESGEQLFFESASFDQDDISLTAGAAEATLSGDVDGDGTDDFVLTLSGDFSDRGFIVTQSEDGTTLTLANVLSGGGGRASITGTENPDIIELGNGKGSADGGGGGDLILGGNGPHELSGGDGNDQLYGGNGKDVLDGGSGDDILDGGKGNDLLTGGQGEDIFIFMEHGGRDTITDFEDGTDLIDLSAFGVSDISELTVSQQGADTQIKLLGGVSITLENFDATNLDNTDFIFG